MKYKRKYENYWNKEKIEKKLQERLQELKNNEIKSKSRIKLLKTKISKLNKALNGKIHIGGQILPNKNKSNKSNKSTNNTHKSNTSTNGTTEGKGANSTAMECTMGKGANSTAMECTMGKGANSTAMECTTTKSTTTKSDTNTKEAPIGAVTEETVTVGASTVTGTVKKKRIKKICYKCKYKIINIIR
uniref:Uncharacterized protein n=1 Tax=Theileria annulata TaxID=5874 RepID=A0A3B0MY06_THEAN